MRKPLGRVNRKAPYEPPPQLPLALRDGVTAFMASEAPTAFVTPEGKWLPVDLVDRQHFDQSRLTQSAERFRAARPRTGAAWLWRLTCVCGQDGAVPTVERHGTVTALVLPKRRWQDRESGKMNTIPTHFVIDAGAPFAELYECRRCQRTYLFVDEHKAQNPPQGHLVHTWTPNRDGSAPAAGHHVTTYPAPTAYQQIPGTGFFVAALGRTRTRGQVAK